uniref:Ovule protein n=1 Tax=Heterorhabditis bacteriophora TaxID=37862 RepID=A0A1I7W9X6_HETBA
MMNRDQKTVQTLYPNQNQTVSFLLILRSDQMSSFSRFHFIADFFANTIDITNEIPNLSDFVRSKLYYFCMVSVFHIQFVLMRRLKFSMNYNPSKV